MDKPILPRGNAVAGGFTVSVELQRGEILRDSSLPWRGFALEWPVEFGLSPPNRVQRLPFYPPPSAPTARQSRSRRPSAAIAPLFLIP
jgi:hypothetical protein